MTSLKDEPGRRVVLVLTNGPDSMNDLPDRPGAAYVERGVRDDGVMLYAVVPFPKNQLISNRDGNIQPRVSLPELVDERRRVRRGAWRRVHARRADRRAGSLLLTALPAVINELRHQYALGLVPSSATAVKASSKCARSRPERSSAREGLIARQAAGTDDCTHVPEGRASCLALRAVVGAGNCAGQQCGASLSTAHGVRYGTRDYPASAV